MDELKVNYKYYGKLVINNTFEIKNVICEIEKESSRYELNGKFIVNYLSAEIWNYLHPPRSFIYYIGEAKKMVGKIMGHNYKTEYDHHIHYLKFKLEEYELDVVWNDYVPDKISILYKIPFMYYFSSHYSYYFKNIDDEEFDRGIRFKMNLHNSQLTILEYKHRYNENIKFYSVLKEFYINIKSSCSNLDKDLVEIHDLVDDFTMMLSFIFKHRLRSTQYEYKLYDKNEEIVRSFEKTIYNVSYGNDLLKEIYNEDFKVMLTSENFEKILNAYSFNKNKTEIKKIIFKYLTIGETDLFEVQFLSAFIVLETICKLIVEPINDISTEKLILEALDESEIKLNELNFVYHVEPISEKLLSVKNLLFYVYRNDLIHYNKLKLEFKDLIFEFEKLMKLNRKLIFNYIDPNFKDFPSPSGK